MTINRIYESTFRTPSIFQIPFFIAFQFHSRSRIPSVLRSHLVVKVILGTAIGWCASSISNEAFAATFIGNNGIRFDQDTTLESSFVESHGAYQSVFGVINLDTQEKIPLLIETKPADQKDTVFRPSSKVDDVSQDRDFKGTPGNSVARPVARYTFKAKTNYGFYLESSYNGRPTGTLYSTDAMNPNREQQAKFSGSPNELCVSSMRVTWDDTGSQLVRDRNQQDRDFDDFVVSFRNPACPIGGGDPPVPAAVSPPISTAVPVTSGGSRLGLLALPLLIPLLTGNSETTGGSGNPESSGISVTSENSENPQIPITSTPLNPAKTPSKSVPEPLTVLGSGAAIGFVAVIQRRRAKGSRKD